MRQRNSVSICGRMWRHPAAKVLVSVRIACSGSPALGVAATTGRRSAGPLYLCSSGRGGGTGIMTGWNGCFRWSEGLRLPLCNHPIHWMRLCTLIIGVVSNKLRSVLCSPIVCLNESLLDDAN
ncbi:hypothetical protein CEXT_302571 [Caerostris extrusa]|uniref:Uncharacterized protein n=1 Tax=Caerostris extrusa TaxID=172846 RepID=A0AAV4VEQ2_CAEEX|nr:hypothetical protein CEXT_302571 [Caerostris extrusa]